MTERIFLGPFLTRAQAARRTGMSRHDVAVRPDLLRIRSRWLEEAYFAFQFDGGGVRTDVGQLVRTLKADADDESIADWLVRAHPALGGRAPLTAARERGGPAQALAAARVAGPVERAAPVVAPPPAAPTPAPPRAGRRHAPRRPGVAVG